MIFLRKALLQQSLKQQPSLFAACFYKKVTIMASQTFGQRCITTTATSGETTTTLVPYNTKSTIVIKQQQSTMLLIQHIPTGITNTNNYNNYYHRHFSVSSSSKTAPFSSTSTSSQQSNDDDYDDDHDQMTLDEIDECNKQYDGKVIVKETNEHGWGVFTTRTYKQGELLFTGHTVKVYNVPTTHTIQTNYNTHIHMDLPARFINHACSDGITTNSSSSSSIVNVGIQEPANKKEAAYDFYAIRDIQIGEQLLWDYETTEYELCQPMQCTCASTQCRGTLKGFKHNADAILKQHDTKWIAPYLLSSLSKE